MESITIKDLMEAGVHFGHQTKRWDPKMKPFIFGARSGIYIIDLQKTLLHFNKAIEFSRKLGAKGGFILLIGTKPQARETILEEAAKSSLPYIIERWLGGMLTNFETIRKSIGRLKELQVMDEDGTLDALSKKESTKLSKEKFKLEKNLGGIQEMDKLPDAVFIVDTKRERIALKEARRLGIPIIAIVDTNCDPDGVTFPIPGNDDASRSVKLITSKIMEALSEGRELYSVQKKAEEEEAAQAEAERAALRKEKKKAVKGDAKVEKPENATSAVKAPSETEKK